MAIARGDFFERSQIMDKLNPKQNEDVEYIFRPYITVKGKRITRKNGGMFKIPIRKQNLGS